MILEAFVRGSIVGKRVIPKALDGRARYLAVGVDILVVLDLAFSLDAQRIVHTAYVIIHPERDLVIGVPVAEIFLGRFPLKSR